MPEFHLFLPQMRMSPDTIVERCLAAENAGFDGVAFMDHLAPPMAEGHPMYDAMVTATWVAAHTSRLTVGHLVLCDAFRHPAVLAKQAVSLDHCSQGRFELGIGWGSVPDEIERFGVGTTANRPRFDRLAESVEVIRALWRGEAVHHDGAYHHLDGALQQPVPLEEIPIVIGGSGPRTLALVAEHATWWNCPGYAMRRFDELRSRVGSARVSVQYRVALVPDEGARGEIEALTARRYGTALPDLVVGTVGELVEHHRGLVERGVERIYVWTTDFADPANLARYGEVIAAFA